MKNLIKVLFLLSGVLFAQTDGNSEDQVEEVIIKGNVLYSDQVHALKTPVPVLDVPQTVTIVTDDEIRSQGLREIGDIVRYTPGVNTSQGEGHRDAVVFRGVRSTADFYLDGVRDDVQYYRSLYNVEQVEILRGPNALLFGRGGTGGIINRVTKKAVLGEMFGGYDLGTDSFGALDFAADYNVQTGDNSALRFNIHSDALENHRDHYDGTRFGMNPTVTVALSDATTLDLSYEYADHERFIDRGIPTINNAPDESLSNIVFGDEDINVTTLEASIMRANVSHKFSETRKGNLAVQSSSFEKMYRNLYASGYDGTLVTMDGYLDPTERDNFIVSGNIVSEVVTGSVTHTILVGAELINTENKNHRYDTNWSTTDDDNEVFDISRPMDFSVNSAGVATSVNFTNSLKSKSESDITVTSLFVQDQMDLTDNVKVMLGGRLDSFDITVDDIKNGTSESRTDDRFSPRAGLIYKPQENISLYMSYSESFLPRSGEQFKALSASSARLDPDVFESTELGLKWAMTDTLSFTAAIFDSEQTRAAYDNDTGENSEIRGLRVDGIELELRGQVSDKLQLAVGYSSLEGTTSSGGVAREVPDHTFSLFAKYQVDENFGWALGITQQGESHIKDNSALVLPEYTRFDFAAYWNVANDMVLRLNVENLTDELYFPHSHSTHQASVGEPLNARVSLSKSF
ncbi:MAG: TonB-dependent siderophore receptor [Rickettsiales bacterium TMED289]|mgnify:FL=1|nr:TonB-dependent siderophore receptor [Gammaproteobacteria bacterium]RPF74444.1 MAG: TonB-dependent siderophore receptor [Rickettsiales bacterium TMED289]|tara:strand:- start:10492 stop:12552 length:2061 start_codon:yes stop_codon:yes gene_type:complete